MTTSDLAADLRRDEGLRLAAYADPLTHAAPWTIGYGHTGPEVRPGLRWTPDQARAALDADIARATAELDRSLPWWRKLDDPRRDVLVNMAFNLGVARLLEFQHMLQRLEAGDFAGAADHMLASAWAGQVGARAQRLATQMRAG